MLRGENLVRFSLENIVLNPVLGFSRETEPLRCTCVCLCVCMYVSVYICLYIWRYLF